MARKQIKRKGLWSQLNNVNQSDWIRAATLLGFNVVKSNSGTSHTHSVRDPKFTDMRDIRSVVAVLQKNLYKQANREIFNCILDYGNGIEEDDIWRALKKLK